MIEFDDILQESDLYFLNELNGYYVDFLNTRGEFILHHPRVYVLRFNDSKSFIKKNLATQKNSKLI